VASLTASAAHFLHNAVFLAEYPGPPWIPGPWFVIVAWLCVATVLLAGYAWHRRGRAGRAVVAVTLYCLSCLLVFGHYVYAPPADFDLLSNALIFSEGTSGMVLWVYFIGWGRRASTGANPT